MIGDVEKMVVVGLIWGTTNSLMRRGAVLWDHRVRSSPTQSLILKWLNLLLTWQYSMPFLINLSASASFFYILGSAPISVAVPVTNAVTFAATAVSAFLLGEEMRVGPAIIGTGLIVLGVWICIS
uniref:Transmembrane protein 234 n=1 Tax=Lilium longiflorum TaxID=4690 RepID=A0A2K9YNF5_LILLO|nr:transmembrane protein 234 [Lilium longiflorum]